MNKTEAVELLSNLSYRPGWTFSARTLGRETFSGNTEEILALLDGNDVIFTMTCETVNTDRDCAAKGYPEPKTLDWELPLSSESYATPEELLRSVFDLLMMIETHESREFFRQKDKEWEAPFHPHKEEGNLLWSLTESDAVSAR